MHPLEALSFSTRVAKRAQYESFTFACVPSGWAIRVRNESHATPTDHEYRVDVDDSVPTSCTCPADTNYEGACKHRVAVAIRPPVLDRLQQRRAHDPVITDGGVIESGTADPTDESDPNADCSECIGSFPCWDCFRTGKRGFSRE
jgi:hypothetical protein